MTTDLSALHALIERAEREGLDYAFEGWKVMGGGRCYSVVVTGPGFFRAASDGFDTSLDAACRAVLDALDGRDGA